MEDPVHRMGSVVRFEGHTLYFYRSAFEYKGGTLQGKDFRSRAEDIGSGLFPALDEYKSSEGIVFEAFGKIRAHVLGTRKDGKQEELILSDYEIVRREVTENPRMGHAWDISEFNRTPRGSSSSL